MLKITNDDYLNGDYLFEENRPSKSIISELGQAACKPVRGAWEVVKLTGQMFALAAGALILSWKQHNDPDNKIQHEYEFRRDFLAPAYRTACKIKAVWNKLIFGNDLKAHCMDVPKQDEPLFPESNNIERCIDKDNTDIPETDFNKRFFKMFSITKEQAEDLVQKKFQSKIEDSSMGAVLDFCRLVVHDPEYALAAEVVTKYKDGWPRVVTGFQTTYETLKKFAADDKMIKSQILKYVDPKTTENLEEISNDIKNESVFLKRNAIDAIRELIRESDPQYDKSSPVSTDLRNTDLDDSLIAQLKELRERQQSITNLAEKLAKGFGRRTSRESKDDEIPEAPLWQFCNCQHTKLSMTLQALIEDTTAGHDGLYCIKIPRESKNKFGQANSGERCIALIKRGTHFQIFDPKIGVIEGENAVCQNYLNRIFRTDTHLNQQGIAINKITPLPKQENPFFQ